MLGYHFMCFAFKINMARCCSVAAVAIFIFYRHFSKRGLAMLFHALTLSHAVVQFAHAFVVQPLQCVVCQDSSLYIDILQASWGWKPSYMHLTCAFSVRLVCLCVPVPLVCLFVRGAWRRRGGRRGRKLRGSMRNIYVRIRR